MKKTFQEYHPLEELILSEIWDSAIFVFDTNVLLNLYRYSEKTSGMFIQTIIDLNKRIWIPYQVGFEFYQNRLNVLSEERKNYIEFQNEVNDLINKIENKNRNPFFSENLTHKFIDIKNELKTETEHKIKAYELKLRQDNILEKITLAFENKVGNQNKPEEIEKYNKEGEKRYKDKTPPGYCDTKKTTNKRYSDLIIWKEIIKISKEKNKNIIFILDDRKEDWWLEHQGKTISPRPELIKEFRIETNNIIHFYKPFQFLEFANKYLQKQISKEIIEEVKNYIPTISNEKKYIQLNYSIEGDFANFSSFAQEISSAGYKILIDSDKEKKVHSLSVTIPNIPDLERRIDSKFITKLSNYDLHLSESSNTM